MDMLQELEVIHELLENIIEHCEPDQKFGEFIVNAHCQLTSAKAYLRVKRAIEKNPKLEEVSLV